MSKQQPTLEQRITAALNNSNIGSADLIELIADVDSAIVEADAAARSAREHALDLVACSDVTKAGDAAATAALIHDRLKRVLPKLKQHLADATAAERRDCYLADCQRVEARRNAAAEKLAHTRQLQEQMLAAFREAEAVDSEISRLHGSAPDDCQERIRPVESYARNLVNFTRDNPSLLKSTQLFDWKTGAQVWPPRSSFAAEMVAGMAFPSHVRGIGGPIGPGWEKPEIREQFQQQAEQDRTNLAAYYEKLDQEQEERQNREERERFAK